MALCCACCANTGVSEKLLFFQDFYLDLGKSQLFLIGPKLSRKNSWKNYSLKFGTDATLKISPNMNLMVMSWSQIS